MAAPPPTADTSSGPCSAGPARHNAWDRPGFLLWHSTLRWQRQVARELLPLGLTHAQFLFLGSTWYLAGAGEGPSQSQLAAHTGCDPMMTSQVVRLLERRGLVSRRRDGGDRRALRVELTTQGRVLAERAIAVMERIDEEFFSVDASMAEVVQVLGQLARRTTEGDVVY
jgi:DNA-binding MarR family transcriptional regulator